MGCTWLIRVLVLPLLFSNKVTSGKSPSVSEPQFAPPIKQR